MSFQNRNKERHVCQFSHSIYIKKNIQTVFIGRNNNSNLRIMMIDFHFVNKKYLFYIHRVVL